MAHKKSVGLHGVWVLIALSIVKTVLIKRTTVMTKNRLLLIKLLTFIVLGGMVYFFSLISQYFLFKDIELDANLGAVLIGTLIFFLLGYSHFEELLAPQIASENED